ncbi:MAG: hypothetical protein G01um10147_1056 [Microgenomates group bacterium Gr01-1014_7]|nr:MAG: hypothetical protein G01um10147_1056 [Microgenomates group bacterium Gr01-1014_7]
MLIKTLLPTMNNMQGNTFLILESELIPILKDNFIETLLSTNNPIADMAVYEELRSPYGIPDLVFSDMNKYALKKRVSDNPLPILSKDIIKTLLLIEGKKKVTLSFLEKTLPYNKDKIKNMILRYLIKNNYLVKSNNSETYWIDKQYVSCLDNLYSIEAKISSWKRGFYQAYRYKWFSHYSFLAIHEKYASPSIRNLELFKKYNIGLLTVSTSRKNLEVLHRPNYEKPYSREITALTFERIFSSYLEKKAASQAG